MKKFSDIIDSMKPANTTSRTKKIVVTTTKVILVTTYVTGAAAIVYTGAIATKTIAEALKNDLPQTNL